MTSGINTIESVPTSLYKPLSEKLVSIILGSENINAVSADTINNIIYLWRLDQLSSPKGIEVLLRASSIIDFLDTIKILNDLGLLELKGEINKIHAKPEFFQPFYTKY